MRKISCRTLPLAFLVFLLWGLLCVVSCGDDNSTKPKSTRTEVIELSETTVNFSTEMGAPDPASQVVSVTNAESGTLSGLTATISYGSGQPTGWLTAILSDTTAPTDITLQATTGGGALGGGTYTATVSVASSKASNSPQEIEVTFTVVARYGFYNEFMDASSHVNNYLLGSKITVSKASTLTHLCLIAKSAGPQVKIGLYTDVGGEPKSLVASTLATALVVGRMEIPVAAISLPAGDYWFMAVYNTMASVGLDDSNPEAVVKYISHTFSAALPATFPSATTYMGQEFNYYIKASVP